MKALCVVNSDLYKSQWQILKTTFQGTFIISLLKIKENTLILPFSTLPLLFQSKALMLVTFILFFSFFKKYFTKCEVFEGQRQISCEVNEA